MQFVTSTGIELAERGWVPDPILRWAIRGLLLDRRGQGAGDPEQAEADKRQLFETLRAGEIAVSTRAANGQHYEVPAGFFQSALGPFLKYSCGWFGDHLDPAPLAQAEEAMLSLTARRAGMEDGMSVLDLGCGWGSFALWAAGRFPGASILAVSNSKTQREFILGRCRERGFENLEVVTADVNHFEPGGRVFDRVVSVEMFEHVRNWERLLARIADWLAPEGHLFVHHFCHREMAYPYEDRDASDWMARHFFTGGLMPSEDWLERHARDLAVEAAWRVDGRHYALTSEAWLRNVDTARADIVALFREAGDSDPERSFRRWRLFFLACAELFAFEDGSEWFVRHALLGRAQS